MKYIHLWNDKPNASLRLYWAEICRTYSPKICGVSTSQKKTGSLRNQTSCRDQRELNKHK